VTASGDWPVEEGRGVDDARATQTVDVLRPERARRRGQRDRGRDDRIQAIFGQGPVGLSATQFAVVMGALMHGEGAHKTLDVSSAPDARAAAVRAVRS
jgi:hypothetical protein